MSSASYTQLPPAYSDSSKKNGRPSNDSHDALLQPVDGASSSASQAHPSNAWGDMPDSVDDIDDFKYGSTVSASAIEVRQAFIRKVYATLCLQLVGTTAVAAGMRYYEAQYWLAQHSWTVFIPLVGAVASMIALFFKRQSYPVNVALLGVFTAFESWSIGSVVCFYDQAIVTKALLISSCVFVGLTLFAMQTKWDLSSMGGVLYTILISFVFVGLIGIFFPYNNTFEMIYAGIGTLLFSAYILYDTYMIVNRLSPDEWVMAVLSLYLDFVNLFLTILRLLNSTQSSD